MRISSMGSGACEVIECVSADEFLKYLQPWEPQWVEGYDSPWIFRGQGDARWPLRPRAWRDDGRAVLQPLARQLVSLRTEERKRESRQYDDLDERRSAPLWEAAEYEAVRQFVDLADQLGLTVPLDAPVPTGLEYLRERDNTVSRKFPSIAFAFAQHHGVPTHLLDWTRNAQIAAFFAADDGERQRELILPDIGPDGANAEALPEAIVVWALHTRRVGQRVDPYEEARYRGIVVVTVPRAAHSFLHAQDGLFTRYTGGSRDFEETGEWASVDEFFELTPRSADDTSSPALRKIILPASESREVLFRLWQARVFRARLMPTYDNISQSLSVRWDWLNREWRCAACGKTVHGYSSCCPSCHQMGPFP